MRDPVVALVAGVAPNVPGVLDAAGILSVLEISRVLYAYAWFSGFAIGGLWYFVGMSLRARRSPRDT